MTPANELAMTPDTSLSDTREELHGCYPVAVDIDALGGGILSGCSFPYLMISTTGIRCLDVIDCTALEVLDLRYCQPGCHITIQACPRLRMIYVTDQDPGAVIHLDNGAQAPSLIVEGAVSQIDACWEEDQFAVTSDGVPWHGVVVRHQCELSSPNQWHDNAECWIALSPTDCDAVINRPYIRHLFISGSDQLRTLLVDSPHAEGAQIEAQGLLALISLCVIAPESYCRIRQSPKLGRITGIMAHCHLSESAHLPNALRVEAKCLQLVLSHCRVKQLTVVSPTDLALLHCSALDVVSLPPSTSVRCQGAVPTALTDVATITVDESLVMSLVRAYPTGPERTMFQLEALIPSMYQSSPSVKALQLLYRLAEQGADPERLWAMRMSLSAKHLSPHRKAGNPDTQRMASASGHWKWQLPDDLCREGWQADYDVWRCCAPSCPDAFHYRRTMIRTCLKDPEGLAMQTMLHAMTRHGGSASRHELDLWCEVMEAMAVAEPMTSAHWRIHARAWVLQYGYHGRLDLAWLSASAAVLSLGDYLDLLMRIGVQRPEIRVRLLRIAQEPSQWREARSASQQEADRYRAKAISLAISHSS